MLADIDLSQRISGTEYRALMDELTPKLMELQQKIREAKIPVLIVFEGWNAAGRGTCMSKVLKPLDPRGYKVFTMSKLSEDAVMHPLLWNYWTKTPAKGRFTLFDRGWHRCLLPESLKKRPMSKQEIEGFYYDIEAFERQLTDGGTQIIKLFLHIGKKEQRRRLEKTQKDPDTAWRVDKEDMTQNRRYSEYLDYFDEMIQRSNADYSRWEIIEANDGRFATVKIYKTIISKLEAALTARPNPAVTETETPRISVLSSVDPNQTMEKADYKKQLKHYQKKLADLNYKLYTKRRPVIILYEGWDAAGKGGNIKRLTETLDPRGYEVVPIAAPSQEEQNHNYLWRFWNAVPKDGHTAIFDRTWYGRVMVERIEGLCTEDEWMRAYREINDMELHLTNHGAIIFKFWLQIDQDEQLARFNSRQSNPLKQYKITDEDWRNREKWPEYETAVDEMLSRTSTRWAPWTIVESNNKRFARIKTIKLVAETLENELS